jgi:ABC-2 type transport system ATP-binding protein
MSMLDARSLTKYYAAIPAIRDVSFTVPRGAVLGLLGPNGSGKSTTVSILTGLLEPSGGGVFFNGVDIRDCLLDYKARIGYVPEEAHLYNYLTGPEYLQFIGQLRGLPDAALRERIPAFIDIFGLRDDQHAPLSAYSKGMRQKILISAALLHNPDLVIFDEPDSGLDVTSSLVLRSLVQALAAEGRMVVYSSHVLEIVERVATDVLILHDGHVAAHGSVADLRTMMKLGSLEQVFRRTLEETKVDDVDSIAAQLVEAMKA